MGNAKIICAVGPDTLGRSRIEQFILGGMDIARCVCLPGKAESCIKCMQEIGMFRSKRNQPLEILFDIERTQKNTGEFTEEIRLGIRQKVGMISIPSANMQGREKSLRKLLDENGGEQILLIAKIEDNEAAERLETVLGSADGIMIGRKFAEPLQQQMMKKVYEAHKIWVTVTQMLDFRA